VSGEVGEGVGEGVVAAEFGVAVGADDEQGGGFDLMADELEEHQGGCVGPLQVFEEQDERLGSRGGTEEARD
jgi:hypothetical protein